MRGKLLIVDDEPIIRQGLTKLIMNNATGWTVAGEAGNGQEAIDKLKTLEPDLIISDIRMPIMDGLELARYVYENKFETTVLLLTGFRDFEYAQAAVRYGVKEFLLKPCPEEEICRVLRQAYEQYRSGAERKEQERRERRIREDYALRALLLRLPSPAGEEFTAENLAGHDFWFIRVNTFLPSDKDYRPEDEKLLHFAVANITEELSETWRRQGRWITVEYGGFAYFLQPSADDESFFAELCSTVHRLLGIQLTAALLGRVASSASAGRLFELYRANNAALHAPKLSSSTGADDSDTAAADKMSANSDEAKRASHGRQTHTGSDSAVSADRSQTSEMSGGIEETQVRAMQTEITSFLLLGQHAELTVYLRQKAEAGSRQVLQERTDALCMALAIREVMRKELAAERDTWDIGAEIRELGLLDTHDKIVKWTVRHIAVLEQAISRWLEERSGRLAERTIRYIEQHYTEECGLAAVASHFHLNPNYFSNLFKRQTGESFTVYLTRFRINKAKMLLTNTDMKISEIAEAVGYSDSNYFATAFKQMTGKPPTEFRKMAQSR